MTNKLEIADALQELVKAFSGRKVTPETVTLYASRLARYPIGAVRHAISEAIERDTSWPSLARLMERCRAARAEDPASLDAPGLPMRDCDWPSYKLTPGKMMHMRAHARPDGVLIPETWIDEGDLIGPDGVHRGLPNAISRRASEQICQKHGWLPTVTMRDRRRIAPEIDSAAPF
jgi:hypothetical protein